MILDQYKNLISDISALYLLRQILTITGLFTTGLIPLMILRKKQGSVIMLLIFSFPLGLSVYAVLGFLLLISGAGFNVLNILIAYAVVLTLLIIYVNQKRNGGDENYVNQASKDGLVSYVNQMAGKVIISVTAGYVAVIILAFIACSGLLSQIVTNDSVYYYSMYPSILSKDGCITAALDKYLTDVGQTTAVIESLPFLFGFDESFGIQHFLNLNFILLYFTALFQSLCKLNIDKKLKITAALLGTLFLISCEPFIILSKWVLSNVYFMEYLFMVLFLALKSYRGKEEDRTVDLCILFMTAFLIMSRMEGGVLVFVTALSLSVLDVKRDKLIKHFVLPLCIMEFGYYGMIFIRLGVDPLYSFLDIKAALLMAAMIAALLVYIIFIRDRLDKGLVPVLLMLMLLSGNLVLFLVNSKRYIANIRAFILNIRLGNGWGSFIIIFGIYGVIFIYEFIKRRFKDVPVMVFLPAALILSIFAVCFARGGILAVRTSDSGNRVLMEMVPLVFYSVFTWGFENIGEYKK